MFAREILRAHANSEGKSRSWLSQAEIWHNETVIIPWSPLTSQSTTAGSSTPTLVFALASSLTTTRQPHEMDLNEIRRCDEHPDVDFSDEKEIARFVRPRKWFALDIGNVKVLRINVRLLFVSRTWTIQRNTVTRSGHPSSCTTNPLAPHTRLASRARVLRRKYKKRQTSLCHMPRHMPYSRPTSKARDHDPDPPPLLPPLKTQWVSSGVAIAILWGFVIAALDDPVGIEKELGIWQKWVSVNFGWFFIVAFVRVTPHEA